MENWSQQLAITTEELATTACANGQEVQTQAADRALALLETMDDMRDQPSFSTMVSRNMARRAQAVEVCQALTTSIDGLQNNQALYGVQHLRLKGRSIEARLIRSRVKLLEA
jgi:ActR/RegA family two-component response regulator